MEAPICLIENTVDGKLVVNPEAINILSGINQSVVVVSIVGMYRTGKSYLMNKLAGAQKGFKLGATIQAETNGIWMWCVPHPVRKDHTLVLLDTEGLGDVGKEDGENNIWIFTLALLLSSAMVYNSKGTIDHAVDELKFVWKLPEIIKRNKENYDDDDDDDDDYYYYYYYYYYDDADEFEKLSRHFPMFIWALRDFPLNLEIVGDWIPADDYLEKALKHKRSHTSMRDMKNNTTRRWLRKYFRNRKCFVFDFPTTNKEFLRRLEEVPEEELNKNFVDQCKDFCDYIWNNVDTKIVNDKVIVTVTGRRLGELVKIYTEALCSSMFVCMKDAMLALAEKENEAAVQESTQHYEDKMKTVGLPTETLDDFMTLSSQFEEEAWQIFLKRSFNDMGQHFLERFQENISRKQDEFRAMNEAKSREVCEVLIKKHSVDFEKALKDGAYHTQGGHARFLEDLKVIEQKYNVENGKGVKAEEVLLKFIMSQQSSEIRIIREDNALNQKQKEEEEENARKKNVAMEEKLQKLQDIQTEQKMESERKNFLRSLKTSREEKVAQGIRNLHEAHNLQTSTSWYEPIVNISKGVAAAVFPGLFEKGGKEATKKNEPVIAYTQGSRILNKKGQYASTSSYQRFKKNKKLHYSAECAKNIISPRQGDPLECKLCGKEDSNVFLGPQDVTLKKDEDSAFLALPVVKGMVYRLELQSAGLFRCSKTGIKFQVTRPVTIEYEVDSWKNYSSLFHNLQCEYEILGPLFNIKTDLEPGVVSAVYLPHCLCLKGFKEDTSCIKCAHFKDDNITLEAPTRVEPYYVVLENPTFSPIGVILYPFMWLRDGITKLLPFHGMVLIYWRISGATDPDHRKFRIHLYLMPHNQSVEMDINSFEKDLGSDRLYKPHQTDFLYCGRKYDVKASQNARVLPKTLLFQSSYVSGLYPYTEVTVDDKETIKGFDVAVEDGDSSVWQAEVDRGDMKDLETKTLGPHWEGVTDRMAGLSIQEPIICRQRTHTLQSPLVEGAAHVSASGEHFVDIHRPALIQAISLVEPILEDLRSRGLLTDEQYGTVCSKPNSQEQMRELYRYITHWGNGDKEKVYRILWRHNRPVINRLEAEGS